MSSRKETIAGRPVTVARREAAPTVLLVRLAARDAGVWDGLWRLLARRYAVAAVELPQPGADAIADPLGVLRGYAASCAEVGRTLAGGPFHFVGWNGGAQIALQAAIRHPEDLATLTLLSPFHAPRDPRPVEKGLQVLEALLASGRRDLYAYYWFMAGLSDRFIAGRFGEVEALVARRLAGDPFVKLDVGRAMAWMRAIRAVWAGDEELRAITLRSLILAGGRNRWHAGPDAGMAERLGELLPNARVVLRPKLGSLFPIEEPEATAREIQRTIDDGQGV